MYLINNAYSGKGQLLGSAGDEVEIISRHHHPIILCRHTKTKETFSVTIQNLTNESINVEQPAPVLPALKTKGKKNTSKRDKPNDNADSGQPKLFG